MLFTKTTQSLGRLKKCEGAMGVATLFATPRSGVTISACDLAKCQYEKGDAALRLRAVKIDGEWELDRFYINSAAML